MKRNSVPRKPRYFSGLRRPTASIFPFTPATMISRRFCQREISSPVESLRVIRCEPPASTNINTHVMTIVRFSFTNPCCQKTTSSELRCIGGFSSLGLIFRHGRPGEPRDQNATQHKSKQARDETIRMCGPHQIECD